MRAHVFLIIAILSTAACPPKSADSTKTEKIAPQPSVAEKPTAKKAIATGSDAQKPAPIPISTEEILDQPFTATLDGKKWTFVAGKAKRVGKKLEITFYDQPLEGCGEPANPHAPYILLPDQNLTPGAGTFSFKIKAGFITLARSKYAVSGKWRIDSVGPKSVSGGLFVDYDRDKINGTFTVPLCE